MGSELIDGTSYVQADSDGRTRSLKLAISTMRRLTFGVIAYFLVACFVMFLRQVLDAPALFMLVCGFVTVTFFGSTWRELNTQLLNVTDTIHARGAGIDIDKPDGTHLSFSPSAKRRWTSGFLGGRLKRFEVWTENGRSYVLDRSHLVPRKLPIEAPSDNLL